MVTAVKTLKEEVIGRISALEDFETLQGVRRGIDYFHPKPYTVEQVQARREAARQAIERGEILSIDELKQEIELWKNRRR